MDVISVHDSAIWYVFVLNGDVMLYVLDEHFVIHCLIDLGVIVIIDWFYLIFDDFLFYVSLVFMGGIDLFVVFSFKYMVSVVDVVGSKCWVYDVVEGSDEFWEVMLIIVMIKDGEIFVIIGKL